MPFLQRNLKAAGISSLRCQVVLGRHVQEIITTSFRCHLCSAKARHNEIRAAYAARIYVGRRGECSGS